MIDSSPDKSSEEYDNTEIRILMRRGTRRFQSDYPEIIQNIVDFTLAQFVGWKSGNLSTPVIVTIKPEPEENIP